MHQNDTIERRYKKYFFYIFSFLGLSMTRPIRNIGPCFPSGLPRQRGQETCWVIQNFIRPYSACSQSSRPSPSSYRESHPRWTSGTLLLALPDGDKYYNQYRPQMWSVPQRPRQGGRVTPRSILIGKSIRIQRVNMSLLTDQGLRNLLRLYGHMGKFPLG